MSLTEHDARELYEIVKSIQTTLQSDRGNAEVLSRLSGLEAEVKSLGRYIKTVNTNLNEKMMALPCTRHEESIEDVEKHANDNTVAIEKSKFTMLISVISMLVSISSLVSVILTVVNK